MHRVDARRRWPLGLGARLVVLACFFYSCGRTDLLTEHSSTTMGASSGGTPGSSSVTSGGSSGAATHECRGVDTQNDALNCGACGVVCTAAAPSKATCQLGHCLVVLAEGGTNTPESLAVTATHVFWTSSPKMIMGVPLGGGTPVVMAAGSNILKLAADADSLYWTDNFNGEVVKMTIATGRPTVLVSGQKYLKGGLAVDASNVYWATWPDTLGPIAGTIKKVPIGGGAITTLLASDSLYPPSIAVNAGHVFWPDNFAIMRVPIGGGSAPAVVTDALSVQSIVADDSNVYFSVGAEIMKAPAKGGAATLLVADGSWAPFAVDGSNIYWSIDEMESSSPNPRDVMGPRTMATIMVAPVTGGSARRLVSFPTKFGTIGAIAVDSTSVYWTTVADSVMKVSPK